jgi:hypothetical protein
LLVMFKKLEVDKEILAEQDELDRALIAASE